MDRLLAFFFFTLGELGHGSVSTYLQTAFIRQCGLQYTTWAMRIVILGLVVLFTACKPTVRQTPATLAVLTDLSGVIEPCGCTTEPLGGLDHLGGRLETLTRAGPTGLVVLGNTFFTYDPPPAAMAPQEKSKASVITRILRHLQPVAVIPGPMDTQAQRPVLASLLEQTPLPVLWQQASQSSITLGGTPVGLVGVPEEAPAAAINEAADALRKSGAALVLAFVASDTPGIRRMLPQLQHVDAVVLGGQELPSPPEPLGNTVLLSAGSKGEHLGVLALQPRTGAWSYFDGGAGEREALQGRRTRMVAEAKNLPEGPGKEARMARITALDADLAKIQATAPTTSTFSWTLEKVGDGTPVAPWAKSEMATYYRALCAPALETSGKRTCPPAADARDAYVGNGTCQACHAGAWEVYSRTQHAHAWKTLTDAGKDCDLGCVGCHTIGYEKPGGFCHLADAEKFANVGCENCHGPAAGHVAHPQDRNLWSKAFVRAPAQETCKGCHTHEHSDKFAFDTYLPKILGPGHGKPIPQ